MYVVYMCASLVTISSPLQFLSLNIYFLTYMDFLSVLLLLLEIHHVPVPKFKLMNVLFAFGCYSFYLLL